MIEIKNMSKVYKAKRKQIISVDQVNLTIEDGEIFGIVGYSGAGKSSLLRCINLLEQPTSGEILVDGQNLMKLKGKDLKNLVFKEIEAAGLPRAVETTDLAGVPGNFALAAGLDLQDAVFLENMPDKFRNVIAVRKADENAQLAKDLKAVVESAEFEKVIDEQFKGFGKPEWMENR